MDMTSSIDVRPRLVNGGVNDKASRIHLVMSRFNGMAFFIYQHKITGSDLGEVHCIRVFDGNVRRIGMGAGPHSRTY